MSISPNTSYADVLGHELKAHGTIAFPAACYLVQFPDNKVPAHWHSELEMIHVIQGRLHVNTGADNYILKQGEGIFINQNVLHTVKSENPAETTIIHTLVFNPGLIGNNREGVYWQKYIDPLIENGNYPVQTLDPSVEWQNQILKYHEESWSAMAKEPEGYEILVRNSLSLIILLLHSHQPAKLDEPDIINDKGHTVRRRSARNVGRTRQMLTFIREHYFEHVTLEDIAAAGMVSKSECCRCFKDILGVSPVRYLNQYRLQMAAQFLRETDWPVSETAFRCGFSEMGYFASEFRKKYGLTPSRYRSESKTTHPHGI